jgi:hypothetical protein
VGRDEKVWPRRGGDRSIPNTFLPAEAGRNNEKKSITNIDKGHTDMNKEQEQQLQSKAVAETKTTLPTSNYCANQLTVIGPIEDLKRFQERAVGHSPWTRPEERGDEPASPLNFHSLVPIPAAVLEAGHVDAGSNWELQHWDVKGGACNTKSEDVGELRPDIGRRCRIPQDAFGGLAYSADTNTTRPRI